MNAESRQRALALVVPAIIAAVVYVYGPARSRYGEIEKEERDLAAARKASPTDDQIRAELARAQNLPGQIDIFRFEKKRLAAILSVSADGSSTGAETTARLLADHNLTLIEEKADATAGAGGLPPSLRTAAEAGDGTRIRTITFSGKFLDVQAAMQALSDSETVLPLALTMRRDPMNESILLWTLTLWT